jgi:AraC-like DNA-binding protein
VQTILQELVYDAASEGAVWPFDRGYIRPPHFHGQIELLLIRRGTALVHLGARSEAVRGGQLCWIPPGVPHVMSAFSKDFDMWVIQLEPSLLGACWRALNGAEEDEASDPFGWMILFGDQLSGHPVVDVDGRDLRDLDDLARGVWAAAAQSDTSLGLRTLGERALGTTLSCLGRVKETSVTSLASCLIMASPTLGRHEVAAELGVSEGFLSRCFSREMGTTFVAHRARTRIAHFLALIQSRGHNLLQAALAAGFGSYTQFHRVFTGVAGSRPRDYLTGGRHQRELVIAGDPDRPQAASVRTLPERQRQLVGGVKARS